MTELSPTNDKAYHLRDLYRLRAALDRLIKAQETIMHDIEISFAEDLADEQPLG